MQQTTKCLVKLGSYFGRGPCTGYMRFIPGAKAWITRQLKWDAKYGADLQRRNELWIDVKVGAWIHVYVMEILIIKNSAEKRRIGKMELEGYTRISLRNCSGPIRCRLGGAGETSIGFYGSKEENIQLLFVHEN